MGEFHDVGPYSRKPATKKWIVALVHESIAIINAARYWLICGQTLLISHPFKVNSGQWVGFKQFQERLWSNRRAEVIALHFTATPLQQPCRLIPIFDTFGLISGIGEGDRQLIMKSAGYSGNRMACETPSSFKQKTPQSFKDIGGPTHMMFEELVVGSETDDMGIHWPIDAAVLDVSCLCLSPINPGAIRAWPGWHACSQSDKPPPAGVCGVY